MAEVIAGLETFSGASGDVSFDSNADRKGSIEVFQAQTTSDSFTLVTIFQTVDGELIPVENVPYQWNDGTQVNIP